MDLLMVYDRIVNSGIFTREQYAKQIYSVESLERNNPIPNNFHYKTLLSES